MASTRNRATLIDQFCAITGSEAEVGERLLEACSFNLDMAIGMHVDNGEGDSVNSSTVPLPNPAASPNSGAELPNPGTSSDFEDAVRAPIPQRTERLVEDSYHTGWRRRPRQNKSVFDGFRDFQAEARQQELSVAAQASSSRQTAVSSSASRKRKTLEDLFRPPIELMFKGSFHSARDGGTSQNKWLMVNIQNTQEFQCQALNRDVWSNPAVKVIVQEHFVFWQQYHDSEEGKKYMQFYQINDWPYIAVLDPITGEKMAEWTKLDPMTFCDLVTDFLTAHPSPDGTCSPPAKRSKKDDILESNEDSQLEAAIKASLEPEEKPKTHKTPSSDSDSEESLETFTDSEDEIPIETMVKISKTKTKPQDKSKSKPTTGSILESDSAISITDNSSSHGSSGDTCSSVSADSAYNTTSKCSDDQQQTEESQPQDWNNFLGCSQDPQSSLMIRFPDGTRKPWKVSCSSKLRALVLYIISEGYPKDQYEVVTTFPRRNLSEADQEQTLKEAGLYPQETVFVQQT